ncbi:MAG: hypothetical protein JWO51_1916 [Rhodospirillales bacterium]|jgi:hypothetical protein|nr:hypothetical protein [Rhodospirillales bacterium]
MATETAKPNPKKEEALDDALADSFPASDPISPGAPHRSTRADEKHIAEHIASRDGTADDK